MKKLFHKLLTVFVIIAFMSLIVGCERTITQYDSDGKPYTTKEFSAWETVGAIFLFLIVIGMMSASQSGGGGTHLDHKGTSYASANDNDITSDAIASANMKTKWIQIVDAKGNFISSHLIQLDELQSAKGVLNSSELQLSANINKKVLGDLIAGIVKANNLSSIPDTIKADVSFEEPNILKINAVDVLPKAEVKNGDSVLIVNSEHGYYRTITRISDNAENQFSIIVSQLN